MGSWRARKEPSRRGKREQGPGLRLRTTAQVGAQACDLALHPSPSPPALGMPTGPEHGHTHGLAGGYLSVRAISQLRPWCLLCAKPLLLHLISDQRRLLQGSLPWPLNPIRCHSDAHSQHQKCSSAAVSRLRLTLPGMVTRSRPVSPTEATSAKKSTSRCVPRCNLHTSHWSKASNERTTESVL